MRILFQGDSITDAERDRSDFHNLGSGYVKYASELIKNRHPNTEFEFINLGIGGDRAECLRDRWQTDCIDLQPDLVSILIGINDTCGYYCSTGSYWLPHEYYEECYRYILTETKKKTNAKIMMIEQFLVHTDETAFKDDFHVDLDPKIQITRKLAREFADIFIPMDGIMASHCVGVAPEKWVIDGVHPTEAGARLIAGYYADAFDKLYASIK